MTKCGGRDGFVLGRIDETPHLPCQEANLEPSTPIPGFFPEWFVGPSEDECVEGVVQLDPSMPYLGALSPKPCGTSLWANNRINANSCGTPVSLYQAYTPDLGTLVIGNPFTFFLGKGMARGLRL